MRISTFERFLEELVKVPVEWERGIDGVIRVKGDYICPVCAVVDGRYGKDEYELAAWSAVSESGIRMPQRLIDEIVSLADNLTGSRRRQRLLLEKACGLR